MSVAMPTPRADRPSCMRVRSPSVGCVSTVAATAAMTPDNELTAQLLRPSCAPTREFASQTPK